MAGIDYSIAHLDLRQIFSFGAQRQKEIYAFLKAQPEIFGCVLIATCNRTELYLSCAENSGLHPFEVLCRACGQDFGEWQDKCKLRLDEEVFVHLNRLACGAASQIWGEDQIISQVKDAIAAAREAQAADGILEVLFRNGITSGKAIKTRLSLARQEQGAAARVLDVLNSRKLRSGHALVIGNGQMAQLTARGLLAQGFAVTMTLRQYKYGAVPIPPGAAVILYSRRYEVMPDCDLLVSATASPHCTVEKELFAALPKKPALLFDLAVPRDIDPAVAGLPGITCFDIDQLGQAPFRKRQKALLAQVDEMGQKYYRDFCKWHQARQDKAV
jgi:glutamyl-tRNA reductase